MSYLDKAKILGHDVCVINLSKSGSLSKLHGVLEELYPRDSNKTDSENDSLFKEIDNQFD